MIEQDIKTILSNYSIELSKQEKITKLILIAIDKNRENNKYLQSN
jgi:hypothetical protein